MDTEKCSFIGIDCEYIPFARKSDAQAKEIERLRNNQSILITSFRVNMMRLCPDYSREEFDKDIAVMLKEKE
jgi:hypothetical protein